MVHTSEKKLFPWTKHTSYASIVGERRPSEVGQGTMATIKNVDKDLNDQRNKLHSMHRKSLFQLNCQRKELEKSMLEYTEKVRQIRDTSTNSLFREIHTRQSQRHSLSDTRSLTDSIGSHENYSLPVDSAKIRRRTKRLQLSKRCMFPPIIEGISKKEKKHKCLRPRSADARTPEGHNNRYNRYNGAILQPEVNSNDENITRVVNTNDIIGNNPVITVEVDYDIKTPSSDTKAPTLGLDSGYSSTVDLSVEHEKENEDCAKIQQNDELLLTLPKIHKRRQKEVLDEHTGIAYAST